MTQLQLPIVLNSEPCVQLAAARKLQRIVTRTRNSFEIVDYRKRRAAMLKGRRAA